MPMVSFVTQFPELARVETRSATVMNNPHLPSGEYGFLDSYCDEPDCDCRRVFVNVVSSIEPGKILATISYGWENLAFYQKWIGFNITSEELAEIQGPALALGNQQSELAPALLELFKEVLQDPRYEARLRRHYRLFKQAIRQQPTTPNDSSSSGLTSRKQISATAASRNALCPCGSGKKYKHCHGKLTD